MDLGMTKWILAGLIECDSATNLSSPGSWAVSPALNSSFPSPTHNSCATQMHSACVLCCAKGQEVLPPGLRQCYSWLLRGEMDLSGADKRRVVWPVSLLVKITWWSVCFQINWSVLQFSVLWGTRGTLNTHPCVWKHSNCFPACVAVFFFCLFFLFPPTAY